MPVSASQLREVRSTIKDIRLMLENEPEYEPFVAELTKAGDVFDEMVDDRGQMLEAEGPTLGSRVKQPEDEAEEMDADEAADRPGGENAPPFGKKAKPFGGSRR